jgi:hypothetical protein
MENAVLAMDGAEPHRIIVLLLQVVNRHLEYVTMPQAPQTPQTPQTPLHQQTK